MNGTEQHDIIVKTATEVTFGNPPTETIAYSGIGHVVLDGGDGSDTIRDPGSGTLILGGSGDDTIIIDATDGSGVWLDGGEGSDAYDIQFGNLFGPVVVADTGGSGSDRRMCMVQKAVTRLTLLTTT